MDKPDERPPRSNNPSYLWHLFECCKGQIPIFQAGNSSVPEKIQRLIETFSTLGKPQLESDSIPQLPTYPMQTKPKTFKRAHLDDEIDRLKKNKASGPDKIKATSIKHLGEKGRNILVNIYYRSWRTGVYPRVWKLANIAIHPKEITSNRINRFRANQTSASSWKDARNDNSTKNQWTRRST